MPEVEVTVYFGENLEEAIGRLDTRIKIKRVMRSAWENISGLLNSSFFITWSLVNDFNRKK